MAEAYKNAQITMGEGDREATRIFADAYGKDSLFFEFLKSLDLYSETLQDNTTLILSTDSPLFKYLDGEGVVIDSEEARGDGK